MGLKPISECKSFHLSVETDGNKLKPKVIDWNRSELYEVKPEKQ